MNKTGLLLVVYSLLLAGFSCIAHYLAPAPSRPTLITGLAGGALCLVWGLRAVAGNRGKALPLLTLTLIPVDFILLSQTFMGWRGGRGGMQGGKAGGGCDNPASRALPAHADAYLESQSHRPIMCLW